MYVYLEKLIKTAWRTHEENTSMVNITKIFIKILPVLKSCFQFCKE